MKFIKSFLSFFGTITTAIVFVINLNFMTSDYPIISKYILLHILIAGLVTALVTAAFFALAEKVGKYLILGSVIHFIAMCSIMVFFGVFFFHWFEFTLNGVIDMVISVAIVYVLVFAISYIQMKKEADEMNKALKERNKEQ